LPTGIDHHDRRVGHAGLTERGWSVRHEIEGIAAAQAQANAPGCVHPVLVEIANTGSNEQAATDVALQLKNNPDVVAVVGMGLSLQRSADAADLLGKQPDAMPMIADVITAEGFDATGSRGKEDDFTNCAASYPNGVGGGYFYRVAYDNSAQINGLAKYLGGTQPDFVLTPTDLSDPYTCTALALVEKHFNNQVTQVKFDPSECGLADGHRAVPTTHQADDQRRLQLRRPRRRLGDQRLRRTGHGRPGQPDPQCPASRDQRPDQ
jgi:hypothetical protein